MLTKVLFAIGIVLIALVLSFFGLREVAGVVSTTSLEPLVLAAVLQIVILFLLAFRLMLIAGKYKRLGLPEAFRISMSGMAISMLTPIAKIGGEPLKIYQLKRRMNTPKATAVIAVDTLAELAISLFAVFVIFLIFLNDVPVVIFHSFIVFLVVIAVIIVALLKLFLNPRLTAGIIRWTTRRISRFIRVEKKDYAKLFYSAFRMLIRDKKIMASIFGVSFVIKLIEFARMWLVFAAIGIFLPAQIVMIIWAVVLVLLFVPWLPGSLGLVEFFGTGALIFFGLTSGTAAAGMLIDRFISFWMVLVLGLAILTRVEMPKKLKM